MCHHPLDSVSIVLVWWEGMEWDKEGLVMIIRHLSESPTNDTRTTTKLCLNKLLIVEDIPVIISRGSSSHWHGFLPS